MQQVKAYFWWRSQRIRFCSSQGTTKHPETVKRSTRFVHNRFRDSLVHLFIEAFFVFYLQNLLKKKILRRMMLIIMIMIMLIIIITITSSEAATATTSYPCV